MSKRIRSAVSRMLRAKITGIGSALPSGRLSNADLAGMIDTTDAWIRENVGIEERTILKGEENTTVLGSRAAAAALESSGVEPGNIRYVICATNSPDTLYPATAIKIQDALGLEQAAGFDIQAGCTGFLHALKIGEAFCRNEKCHVLVLGSDALSTELDYTDRNSILFGDGAGAAVLSPEEGESGIRAVEIGSRYSPAITLRTPYSADQNSPFTLAQTGKNPDQQRYFIEQNGRQMLKLTLGNLPHLLESVLAKVGWKKSDLDLFIPHQTNINMIRSLAEAMDFPLEKIPLVFQKTGSISTATLPHSLVHARDLGLLRPGAKVLLGAYGAGFTWGAAALTF